MDSFFLCRPHPSLRVLLVGVVVATQSRGTVLLTFPRVLPLSVFPLHAGGGKKIIDPKPKSPSSGGGSGVITWHRLGDLGYFDLPSSSSF